MTRDDIEEWLEKNVPEAIENLPDRSRSVGQWVKELALNLVKIAKEEAEEAEGSEEIESSDEEDLDELDDEGGDEEEG